VPLFLGTPWDVMRGWLEASPPVVHHRIGLRHVVLVGDAAGMKRIFQACSDTARHPCCTFSACDKGAPACCCALPGLCRAIVGLL